MLGFRRLEFDEHVFEGSAALLGSSGKIRGLRESGLLVRNGLLGASRPFLLLFRLLRHLTSHTLSQLTVNNLAFVCLNLFAPILRQIHLVLFFFSVELVQLSRQSPVAATLLLDGAHFSQSSELLFCIFSASAQVDESVVFLGQSLLQISHLLVELPALLLQHLVVSLCLLQSGFLPLNLPKVSLFQTLGTLLRTPQLLCQPFVLFRQLLIRSENVFLLRLVPGFVLFFVALVVHQLDSQGSGLCPRHL